MCFGDVRVEEAFDPVEGPHDQARRSLLQGEASMKGLITFFGLAVLALAQEQRVGDTRRGRTGVICKPSKQS